MKGMTGILHQTVSRMLFTADRGESSIELKRKAAAMARGLRTLRLRINPRPTVAGVTPRIAER